MVIAQIILVETGREAKPRCPVKRETAVGIDVGLKSFAVLSDGTEIQFSELLHLITIGSIRTSPLDILWTETSSKYKAIFGKLKILAALNWPERAVAGCPLPPPEAVEF